MTVTELLEALPDNALVPVSWVREQLGAQGGDLSGLRSVAQVASRLSRRPSTVRGWCERGRFSGAFKLNGRDWRIPVMAVEAFIAGHHASQVSHPVVRSRKAAPDLSTWKRERAISA